MVAGRRGLPGCEYHTFHASTGGSALTCNKSGQLIMGHKDIMKEPQKTFHGLLALGMLPAILGAMSQSHRALFVSFSLPLVPKGQQGPHNTSGGLLSPKATSKWPFALAPGPQVQAIEYFLCFPMPGFSKASLVCTCS